MEASLVSGEPLRIALLVPSLRGGGLERIVRDLAIQLAHERLAPEVFGTDGLGVHADVLRQAGIPVWDCRETGLRVRGYPRRLVKRLRIQNPHLLHAHSGTWLPAVIARKALGGRIPLLFTDHGRYSPEPRLRAMAERWYSRHTDRIVAVSSPLSSYLQEFLRLPVAPMVIPNGINLAKFNSGNDLERAHLRSAWGLKAGDQLAVAVGRLAPVKNHATMLSALAEASSTAPGLHLLLLGEGALEPELRRQAETLGVTGRVHFAGFRDDVAACLAAADFWVSASRTEGLPLALLEAMAAGLPIVATAVGGVPETLGGAGVLVTSAGSAELARAMAALATDPARRRDLGRRSLERVQGYSLEAMVRRYRTVYEELLAPGVAA
ncbi:MAG: glycosyltransferase [Gemmatimonadales bacterium]